MRRLVLALLVVAVLVGVVATTAGGAAHHSLQLRKTTLGRVVGDGKGRTLYRFERDHGTRSACSGPCANAWPPATVKGKATVGKGLSARLLGKARRKDGTTQLTYRGHPLYRFVGDASGPGSVKGQGVDAFGAKWFVVGASGRVITKRAPAAAATPAPTSTGAGGY